MKFVLELLAEIESIHVTLTTKLGSETDTEHEPSLLDSCGTNGEGILTSGVRYKIEHVCYKTLEDSSLIDPFHTFPFKAYVALGKPTQLKIKRTIEYLPVDPSQ